MNSKYDLIMVKKCLRQVVIEKSFLVPAGATTLKIENLSQIRRTSYKVYFFSLLYSYMNKTVKTELLLKVFEPVDFCRKRCHKEYQILKYLKGVNFPVPAVFVMEEDESLLGAPFIIMERIEGENLAVYVKNRREREITDIIKRFTETLVFLHKLQIGGILADFFEIPEDKYSYARECVSVKGELNYAKNWDYGWVTEWLKKNSKKFPISHYSLLHYDVSPKHFIVTKEGQIFFIDWELSQLGDALRDVGVIFQELRYLIGAKAAISFLDYYVIISKREIDYFKLRFYIICTGFSQLLHIRYLTTKLGVLHQIKLFGIIYIF